MRITCQTRSRILLPALFAAALFVAKSALAAATHPMDGLTAVEVELAANIARQTEQIGSGAVFPTIRLKEWPKEQVYAWSPGDPIPRFAHVVAYRDGKTFEADIDLDAQSILDVREVAGVQPGVMTGEWYKARDAVLRDPRLAQALARRGITSLQGIFCSPQSAGLHEPERYGDKRILRVNCYRQAPRSHPFGLPVPGLHFVVDADSSEILEVVEDDPFTIPADDAFAHVWPPAAPETAKPVFQVQPDGVNFRISGALQVEWKNWSFHMRVERREGPVISLVKFRDGGRDRMVAYQMFLSEMYVPYNDPATNWRYRAFLDGAEFGLGSMASRLIPGADCPRVSAYISIGVPNDGGTITPARDSVCIFERSTGNAVWRHGVDGPTNVGSRAASELVVRMVPTIGNYDYPVDFVFTPTGTIHIRVGATGFDAIKTVRSANQNSDTIEADTASGNLIAPHTVAPFHDHYYSFYVDLDVDGAANSFSSSRIEPAAAENGGARQSLWRLAPDNINAEGALSGGPPNALWRVINEGSKNYLGQSVGYQIMPQTMATALLNADDDPQQRAAFSSHRMWVTARRPDERYSSGDYPTQARGRGLPVYVGDAQALSDTDIVVWPMIGFRHITRTEDWPILNTMWHQISIRPFNFFDTNPAARR